MAQTTITDAITDLILEVFRLNGRLLVAGDRLVAGLGLTSARWQVLGAMALAERPQPVAWLARSMGLHRQGVQRIVNELEKEALVAFAENPNHRRAQLVILTARGRAAYEAATRLQGSWAKGLAEGFSRAEIEACATLIGGLRKRLE